MGSRRPIALVVRPDSYALQSALSCADLLLCEFGWNQLEDRPPFLRRPKNRGAWHRATSPLKGSGPLSDCATPSAKGLSSQRCEVWDFPVD
eukprot:929103-Pyramimonas_sp.AAC.1